MEGRNRIDLVAEYASTGKKPPEFTDNSSYLLLMIMELCFCLEEPLRDQLIERYYRRVVKGLGDDGEPIVDDEVDLMGWVPPKDWSQAILEGQVVTGISLTTNNFETIDQRDRPLSEKIKSFVEKSRRKFPYQIRRDIPSTVYFLACVKHRSPLPSEFWRSLVFGESQANTQAKQTDAT